MYKVAKQDKSQQEVCYFPNGIFRPAAQPSSREWDVHLLALPTLEPNVPVLSKTFMRVTVAQITLL